MLSPTFLVAVPEGLDSAVAATAPLDAVTAGLALRLGGGGRRVLVHGASGAVGSIAVQLATQEGRTVVGTASDRTRAVAEGFGIPVVDYRGADWMGQARQAAGGAFDTAIDHIGTPEMREVLAPDGVLVHTAFTGRPGHERADSLRGSATAMWQRHPRERVCSVPSFVRTKRPRYRALLTGLLAAIEDGRLQVATPEVYAFDDLWEAERAAENVERGHKVVLAV